MLRTEYLTFKDVCIADHINSNSNSKNDIVYWLYIDINIPRQNATPGTNNLIKQARSDFFLISSIATVAEW